MNLKGRDFLTLRDFTGEEIQYIVDLGLDLKDKLKKGIPHPYLQGKSLAMIFQKSSTRTRVSFEVGMYQLGGQALFLSTRDLQIGRGEPVQDTARVLSRYVDGILIRTYEQAEVEAFAKYADVPVINGLTDTYHPTQIIADLITIKEQKGHLKGLNFCYVGDGNNMAHSLAIGMLKCGLNVGIATPDAYQPDAEIMAYAKGIAAENGCEFVLTNDPKAVVKNADVVYTDTWASMGQEDEKEARAKAFAGYTIDADLFALAKDDAIFMHCLPAYRGYEMTEDVLEHERSVVFDEAENRMHAHKAIMAAIM